LRAGENLRGLGDESPGDRMKSLLLKGAIMSAQLEQRLIQLEAEYESGQKMLADLEAKEANVRETMLRISGAIRVLKEELAKIEEQPGTVKG
jgi:hypothetical protein